MDKAVDRTGAVVIWLTGIPGAGKTTIAKALHPKLLEAGYRVELLDGDVVRSQLSPDLGFTKQDRELHGRRVVYLCKLLSRNGIACIVSLISPYRDLRDFARREIGNNFFEVHVQASLETCIKRDPKGLYKKALAGEIKDLTGLQDKYEPPLNPELTVNTETESLESITTKIASRLAESNYHKNQSRTH